MEFIRKYQQIIIVSVIIIAVILLFLFVREGCNSHYIQDKQTSDSILTHKLRDAVLEGRSQVAAEIARQIDSAIIARQSVIVTLEKRLQPIYIQPITNPDTAIRFLQQFAKENME